MKRRDIARAYAGRWGLLGALHGLRRLPLQLGGLEARQVRALELADLREAEFRAYSQWGEDGIVQWLVAHVPIEHDVFVEFGVQDYTESNTRFLLEHDNWRGVILDGGTEHLEFLRRSGLGLRHDIDAVQAFITRENIDALLRTAGLEGDIGLLSVDIDGNDLWVTEAITQVSPRILIVEYNSHFGPEAAVSIPYDPEFTREAGHPSLMYYGASLAAIARVAERKGYVLAGANRAGNNAFFVREDVAGRVPRPSVAEAWRPSRFRESRAGGVSTYVGDHRERLRMIRDMPLVELDLDRDAATVTVAERFGV